MERKIEKNKSKLNSECKKEEKTHLQRPQNIRVSSILIFIFLFFLSLSSNCCKFYPHFSHFFFFHPSYVLSLSLHPLSFPCLFFTTFIVHLLFFTPQLPFPRVPSLYRSKLLILSYNCHCYFSIIEEVEENKKEFVTNPFFKKKKTKEICH